MPDKKPTSAVEIQRLLPEISETKATIKNLSDQIKDVVAQNTEYQQLQTEINKLTDLRTSAKQVLLQDRDWERLNSELEDLRFKLRDLTEILSAHLLQYYQATQSTEIADDQGVKRPVIITAKLGKSADYLQGKTT